MTYNVFTTEAEAITACDADWLTYKSSMPTEKIVDEQTIAIDNTAYLSVTTCWSCPRQRLDGKWCYPKYENSTGSYTEETYSQDWFEVSE